MSSTAAPMSSLNAVVDASAIVDLIKGGAAAPALRRRLSGDGVLLYAPAVIDLEILHTMRRYVLARQMDAAEAQTALDSYAGIEILRFAHDTLFFRIWQLRDNLTAYDAAYVALAEGLKTSLITLDARLAKAAPPTVRVELFA